ncbi:hypothetical protein [Nonomuraea rubra]|uniref:hypothetical protein n=1 Tax=Nonomuraea rubra TaxID=46180 RepID=UPI0033FA62CE
MLVVGRGDRRRPAPDLLTAHSQSYTTALRHVAGRARRHHHESALLRDVLGGGLSGAGRAEVAALYRECGRQWSRGRSGVRAGVAGGGGRARRGGRAAGGTGGRGSGGD